MEPLKRSTDSGKPQAKPKKKEASTIGSSLATLPPLWPSSASALRRSLFDPSSIIGPAESPAVAQTGSVKVLSESKRKEGFQSGASISCTDLPYETAKSLPVKDESRVNMRDLISLPAIVVGVSPESSCASIRVQLAETKWMENHSMTASESCNDIPGRTADESIHSSTEKSASRVTRRDLFNLPSIGPSVCPGSPHLSGSRKSVTEIKWSEKPKQKSLLSSADISVIAMDEAAAQRAALVEKVPITGMELVQLFLKQREVGELKVFYLKEQAGGWYRPYNLRVVPAGEAGSEHYVFSSTTVLHVTQSGYGGLVSLEEWHRESVLWTALQAIPFFRDFTLRNAVSLWFRNVREIVYKRRFEVVRSQLLTNIPQYRNGIVLLSRTIEELKATQLLPLDESKSYTLLEFQKVLETCMENTRSSLKQLAQFRIGILKKAKEESYRVLKELQEHLQYADMPHHCCKIMHLHQAHLNELQKDFAHAENVLQKLANFAALVNHIIVQSLVTVVQQNMSMFLRDVLKRENPHNICLFQTDLRLGAGQLTLDPPLHLFREILTRALLTAGDSISQMCDSCGFFLEVSSPLDCQDESSDPNCTPYPVDIDTQGELKDNNGMPGLTHYSCCQWIREQRPHWKLMMMTVEGHRMPGSYYRLSEEQLMWYITINDVGKLINREKSELMQAAESEIQQMLTCYTWLLDVHVFINQWSQASLENMKGQPASLYCQLITKLRRWLEEIHAAPSFISTSNQLFIIHYTQMKEHLGQQLSLIENEVQEELVKQMKLCTGSLLKDLEEGLAALKTEPKDLHDLPKYVDVVWKSVNMLPEMQTRLEYSRTLQDGICLHYREMTIQELTLSQKMSDTWDCYYSHLKHADSTLRSRLPTAAAALDTMFPWMASDLRCLVSYATSGQFLDPRQNADKVVSELNYMNLRVEKATSNLELLSKTGEIFVENPVDLSDLTDIPKLTARKELWELTALCRQSLHRWNKFLFTELALSQAQEQITQWQQQVAKLAIIIPADDAVLRETAETIDDLSCRLKILAGFRSPTIKPKHRTTFFRGIGLRQTSDKNATLAQLIFQPFDLHRELINKICSDAKKENSMEKTFQKIQQAWTDRIFLPHTCTGPRCNLAEPQVLAKTSSSDGLCDARIIIGLEFLFTDLEKDLMILTNMHRSRHSVDFRLHVEEWMHILQELEKLLHLFDIYQQEWIFLTNIFQERTLAVQRWDLLAQFRSVDERFKTMMRFNSSHPNVLNLVRPKAGMENPHGSNLCQILLDDLSTLNAIAKQMANRLHARCKLFPRLYFLSEMEVVELLSLQPTPVSLLPFVRKFFKGVQWLEVEDTSVTVEPPDTPTRVFGVFGNLREHVSFLSPVEPNRNVLIWLSKFQDQLKFTMEHLLSQCADERKQLERNHHQDSNDSRGHVSPVLDMTLKYPLQCLLVAEEAVWCSELHQALQDSSNVKISRMKAFNSAQLEDFCQATRDAVARSNDDGELSKYSMTCLRALVLLRIKHAQQLTQLTHVQCQPALSFEWLSSLKYSISSEDQSPNDDPKCYVDILGHRLEYGYEYFGPEDFGMVHTPCTDRVILGILLAVKSYRCGFVNGPWSSGKTNTVVHLGKALGRHVVMLNCSPNMKADIFQKMLLGALLTGAWLVLDSVDLLLQSVQASLAQHLEDIYQSFVGWSTKRNERGKMLFSGIGTSVSPNYASVLISSSGISQSLRFSTRPVTLTCPDNRIIVEILLTSFGFKEAKCLSRRLVSLIGISKDSLCLPHFMTRNPSSHLVILQNITSASRKRFKQIVRDERFSGRARQSFVLRTILKSPENENADHLSEDEEQAIFPGLLEEIAVVQAIHSVLSPLMHAPKKVSHFNSIVEELFPIACQFPYIQQYTQDEPNYQLREAVSEELDQLLLHSDSETICQALTLYQTLSFSHAVILLGPSGSGKSTCYNALAGGLGRLANKTEDQDENVDTTEAKLPKAASDWSFVNTVVLFPNAMSHEELFGGFCDESGWQDGAVTKALRDSERRNSGKFETRQSSRTTKWLVMDGEPFGKPCWLDHLSTLSDLAKPFLSLPSGETITSPKSRFKFLVETTDLSDASPSAATRCSLIYFSGTDVWKSVWKSEMDSLHYGFTLDQATLELWTQLSEDLFSSTLNLLKKKKIRNKGQASADGLAEITSFVRILRALLHHFTSKRNSNQTSAQKADKPPGRDLNINQDLFLLAYIWGFGGHLHPRLWPQFDTVARQALLDSRSQIAVPHVGTVFEFFFNIDDKIYSNNTLLTKYITPKHWKYTCLLSVMLEAIQPVLVAGEPGSGKSTVCNTLLCFDKPHIKVPASSMQAPTDLRHLLCEISFQKSCQKNKGVMAKPGLTLYVDDLHETPRDVTGKTSKILETLRQSISKGGVVAFDCDHFKVLSPGFISYLATCCVFELDNPHVSVISSRLSRLFSVFALPSSTAETIFSIHSPQLKLWLRDAPFLPSVSDTIRSIINATENLYEDVCKNFQPTQQSPYFLFSHHDLKKVFQGMSLWQPVLPKAEPLNPKFKSKCSPVPQEPLAMELSILHLWTHECMRTFGDRISSEDGRSKLQSLITKAATAHFRVQSNLDMETTFLQRLLEAAAKLTYGPEFIRNHFPVFKRSSYQPQNVSALIENLLSHLDVKDKDVDRHFAFKYAVHTQRVCQMLHIFRALLIPGGHGLLMASGSGTGRKTTVRLAAYVSGCHLMEVHAGNQSELNTILKRAGNQTRVRQIETIILVHENISSSVREELLVALNSYPGLYTDQELAKLVSRVTAVYKTKKFLLDSWIFDKYLCQNLRDVHVFILMPALESDSRGNNEQKAQTTKALSLCCVEMYQPWLSQSLAEVAIQHLKNICQNLKLQGSPAGLAVAMAGIHQSAYQYALVLLTTQPFSPYTYMAFISHFGYICKVLHDELESRSNRLNTALSHLDALDNLARKYKQELTRMQGIVAEIQKRVDELLGAIEDQKHLLQKAETKCAKQEKKIQILGDRIAESENELSPYFQAALDVLHSLDPLDLEEVRHYRDPPDGVVLVMDAVLLLFERPFGWANAKRLFLHYNVYKCLVQFDFYTLIDVQMLQLAELIKNPIFVPECIREVSKACETLCRWILSVNNCGTKIYQLMVRKQLDLMLLRAQDQLEQIQDHMEGIKRCLKELDNDLQPVLQLLSEKLLLLHKAEALERTAANAVELLSRHARVWRDRAREVQLQRQSLPGDAIFLAAIISYFGPFSADVRTELLSKWRALYRTGIIDPNPRDARSSLFTSTAEPPQLTSGFPVALSETLQPLLCRALGVKAWPAHETLTTRLVLKLLLWGCRRSWVKYWPLLADTKHHLEINSKNGVITGETGDDDTLGKEFECDIVVCADDPKLMCKLDLAAEKGMKVLVTHVERVPVSPQFLATLARPAASCPPGSNQPAQQTNPDFCLLLSTHYPARLLSSAIHPSILAQVDVVDLAPSSDQVQELMLTQLLQSECEALMTQHLRIQNDKQLMRRKLVTELDSVMDSVLQSDTTRMQTPEFLSQLVKVRETMSYAQTELQLVDERQEFHAPLLVAPQQLIKLAWLFYQALQEVSRLSPAYYFPLSAFMAVMQEVFAQEASKLMKYGTGTVLGGVIPEIRNKMVGKLIFYYRPCLFRSHGPVFKLLLTLAVMQTNQLCSQPERTALLMGFADTHGIPPAAGSSKDHLISPQVDSDLLCLEKIPDFTGLTASLTSSREEWREYLRSPSSVVAGPPPCDSHSHLSLIQRALLAKTLRPHATQVLAEAMAARQFRPPRHSAPHCANPGALYRFLVDHKGPIILTWPSPSKDKWTNIQPVHLVKLLASMATDTKEVKVLSMAGLCDSDFILFSMEKSIREGHWLVLNNCHLLEHWDAKVVARFNQLFSPYGATKHINSPHPDFRAWFLTEETTQTFLPASVRMHGLPLVCDCSWNLKEELSCSLQYLSGSPADDTELLLRCATFHSVLLQREAYKYSGQARIYSWSQSDLVALVDALVSSASLCLDKIKTLQYIAVNLVHGAHVLDSADSEAVQNIVETCFSATPPQASGPHTLANIIISTEHGGNVTPFFARIHFFHDRKEFSPLDFADLQRKLDGQLLLRAEDISEPLLLGFSADVEAEMVKINSRNLNKMLQASQTPHGLAARSSSALATLPELSQARERLHALQDYLTQQNQTRARNAGEVFQSPLYDFLLSEWHELSGSASSLLSRLRQPLRYLTETFLSLPTLTALSRLQRRAELLSAYLWRDNDSAPRAAYRLSAFAHAKGFLVALRRKAAQVNHKYISDIALHLEVRDDPLFTPRPKDMVDLCDLELQGASWDVHRSALQNSLSPQSYSMPLICIKAHVKDAHFPRPRNTDEVYRCPIYLEDLETGEEGRDDLNIITTVPLPTELEPSLCSLRKVRLVSRLFDSRASCKDL
ncbi:dynein heavy chain domain-containing protein 1 isoform 3-T7 [Syngnathus typhle]